MSSCEIEDEDPTESRNYVTALARGLEVIRAFTGHNQQMTLADIARVSDLPRATVRRCLITLQTLGYVESQGRFFSLTPHVLTLAQAYLRSSVLPRVAQPFLEGVSEATGESCSASILNGAEVIYVARSSRKRIASLHRDVGTHLPAYCTSMGRVLLAALSPAELDGFLGRAVLEAHTPHTLTDPAPLRAALARVALEGFCVVDQELEIDLRGLAVPLRNGSGRVVAALNISTQAGRTTREEMLSRLLPALRNAAAEMRPLLLG
ncbi:MAG: IclR family transcriptional regulator C-terminal domain-containing protein [Acetobacteraceae bacterium]|nr:IclR family transcriptional regulator C-terminal domain-containing protein [Acetobacteraceae bacterium]